MSGPDDVFVWSDGTWCYRFDYSEYRYMSDDFEVLREGTQQYSSFIAAADAMEAGDLAAFISSQWESFGTPASFDNR